jgi:CheY-like chemotaxis protein
MGSVLRSGLAPASRRTRANRVLRQGVRARGCTRFQRTRRGELAQFQVFPDKVRARTYDSPPVPSPRPPEAEDVRVLVVEDRPKVREAVAATIDREPGVTVGQAGSLAEAREMLEGVDMAILDLALPDGNGADLINELHAVNPEAKAVVFTSSIEAAETDQAVERGAAAVISKLEGIDQLLATVRCLRRRDG